jgi:hypothetical protein
MTTTSAALVPIQPAFTDAERLALAGFLAGYRGLTREAYALDLRQVTTWCRTKVVTIPLAPRTAGAIDLAIGERTDGPVFLALDGRRLDRHGAELADIRSVPRLTSAADVRTRIIEDLVPTVTPE